MEVSCEHENQKLKIFIVNYFFSNEAIELKIIFVLINSVYFVIE